MASVKVTVTMPEEQLAAIRQLVSDHKTPTVSGFIQHAVSVSLDDVAGWQAALDDALAETGGPPTEEEQRWAEQVLTHSERSKRSVA